MSQSKKKLTLNIVIDWRAFRWGARVRCALGPDGTSFIRTPEKYQGKEGHFDAWALRDKFLALRNPEEASRLFDDTDFLREESGNQDSLSKYARIASFEDVAIVQRVIRRYMVVTQTEWKKEIQSPAMWVRRLGRSVLVSDLEMVKDGSGRSCQCLVVSTAGGTLAAIMNTVKVDQASGSQYRPCERPGCDEVFRLESRRERKFCSERCAHLMAVWRSRGKVS